MSGRLLSAVFLLTLWLGPDGWAGAEPPAMFAGRPTVIFVDETEPNPSLISKSYPLLLSHAFVARDPLLAAPVWRPIAAIKADPGFQASAGRAADGS